MKNVFSIYNLKNIFDYEFVQGTNIKCAWLSLPNTNTDSIQMAIA